jgi:hypothetical protein
MFPFASELWTSAPTETKRSRIDIQQVPTCSNQDMNFFLHGSMSTEAVPENVLRAFIKIYPDLFPTCDLALGRRNRRSREICWRRSGLTRRFTARHALLQLHRAAHKRATA